MDERERREAALRAEAHKAELRAAGNFEELLKLEEEAHAATRADYVRAVKAQAIKAEARRWGAVDVDAIAALADLAGVRVDGDFGVTGAVEAVEAMRRAKPRLFGAGPAGGPKIPPPKSMPPGWRG